MKLLQKILALSVAVATACASSLWAGPTYTTNQTLNTPYVGFSYDWYVYTGASVTSTISITCTAGAAAGGNANLRTNPGGTTVHTLQVMAHGSSGGSAYGSKTTNIATGNYRINHNGGFSGAQGNSASYAINTTLSW